MEGKELLKKIITNLLDKKVVFSYINGVLSFDGLPNNVEHLWFWFGDIRIAKKGDKIAGEMNILKKFSFDKDDNFVIEEVKKSE